MDTHLVVDTSLYYEAEVPRLLERRGIKQPDEGIQDVLSRVINTVVEIDAHLNRDTRDERFLNEVLALTESKTIAYGTQILSKVGNPEATIAAACTVPGTRDHDGTLDYESFVRFSQDALYAGMGTGYDLSHLHDPAAALLLMNDALLHIDNFLTTNRNRPAAALATLRTTHPDVLRFISAKIGQDFSRFRFNISVFVTEDLFNQAIMNAVWLLRDQYGRAVDEIPAKNLIEEIAKSAHYCGEPGILFKDRFEADNPIPELPFVSAAPCAEFAMSEGEVCHFSYINVSDLIKGTGREKHLDFVALAGAASTLTRVLDAVVQFTIENGRLDKSVVAQKRSIGIGITGFASLLMNLDIPYDSPLAVKLASQISECLDFHSKSASVALAKCRGVFPAFPASRYVDSGWVRRKRYNHETIIGSGNWENLFHSIEKWGIRNASTTVFPPAGTSSRIVGTSPGIEPYLSLASPTWDQTSGEVQSVYSHLRPEVLKALSRVTGREDGTDALARALLVTPSNCIVTDLSLGHLFATATQVSPSAHLHVAAGFQKFADGGVSKTVNLPSTATVKDVCDILWEAYHLGLKGIAVFRDGCLLERL